jgi:hypothetical protein
MTSGKVVAINRKRGMFIAQLDTDLYSLIEIFDSYDAELGTELKGNMDDVGSCQIYDLDSDTSFEGIVQIACCTLAHAQKNL